MGASAFHRRASPDQVHSESQILKPRDPKIDDEDEWPQYTLTNAQVYNPAIDAYPTDDSITSLILAAESLPLAVVGKLDRLAPSEARSLKQKHISLPITIRIDNVQHFAYGQYDTGEIAFWAAGAAGWFEIKPAKAYKSIHREMKEVIGMLYFVADLWRETQMGKKAKNRKMDIDTVFEKYSEDPLYKCKDARQARQAFRRQRRILGELMSQGKEGVAWKKTDIYKWLRSGETSGDTSASEDDSNPETLVRTPASSSSDSIMTKRSRLAGKGKSILRPSSTTSKSAKKAALRQKQTHDDSAALDSQGSPAEENSDEEMLDVHSSRAVSLKRTAPGDNHGSRQSKRSKRWSHDSDPAPSSSSSASDDTVDLPLKYSATANTTNLLPTTTTNSSSRKRNHNKKTLTPSKPPLAKQPPTHTISLETAPLPSLDMINGVWECSFAGCDHRVYDTASELGRSLVHEHWRDHALHSQRLIDLVHSEERPYLQGGHLIQKIREMAAGRKAVGVGLGGEVNGAGADAAENGLKPVSRRY